MSIPGITTAFNAIMSDRWATVQVPDAPLPTQLPPNAPREVKEDAPGPWEIWMIWMKLLAPASPIPGLIHILKALKKNAGITFVRTMH